MTGERLIHQVSRKFFARLTSVGLDRVACVLRKFLRVVQADGSNAFRFRAMLSWL